MERDFWLALDLLNSPKDHVEFTLVRDWIETSLQPLSASVTVEVPKSVLKQGAVQHLYGRLAAELKPDSNDAHLLQALHPTPAVCGRPRAQALGYLTEKEGFDRGFYSGPFGWISGAGAEFVVAIRSALVQEVVTEPPASLRDQPPQFPYSSGSRGEEGQHVVSLYAGVGLVVGSDPAAEWQELDLKVRQYRQLLLPPRLQVQAVQAPPAGREQQPLYPAASSARPLGAWLEGLPNINMAWCSLLVEELCRQGAVMFCIAPGEGREDGGTITW